MNSATEEHKTHVLSVLNKYAKSIEVPRVVREFKTDTTAYVCASSLDFGEYLHFTSTEIEEVLVPYAKQHACRVLLDTLDVISPIYVPHGELKLYPDMCGLDGEYDYIKVDNIFTSQLPTVVLHPISDATLPPAYIQIDTTYAVRLYIPLIQYTDYEKYLRIRLTVCVAVRDDKNKSLYVLPNEDTRYVYDDYMSRNERLASIRKCITERLRDELKDLASSVERMKALFL